MYVLPQGVGFLRRFGLKTGIRLCSFWSGTGYGFPGNCVSRYERIYCFNSKWVRKKEKYANSKWIFRNLFCCCSNLSCDEIISRRPGLRTGVKNDIFWSEIRSGFGEPGGTPPTKNSQEYPPGNKQPLITAGSQVHPTTVLSKMLWIAVLVFLKCF